MSDLVILVTYVRDVFNNNATCDFRIFAESNYIHFGNTVYVWPPQVEARQPFQNNRMGALSQSPTLEDVWSFSKL